MLGNALLHGQETDVFADAGYRGAHKRPGATGAVWDVAKRARERKRWKQAPRVGRLLDYAERVKASVRAKVEHPLRVLKLQFRLPQVALSRVGEEHRAVAAAVRADEPVAGAARIAGDGGVRRPEAQRATRAALKMKTKETPERRSSMRGAHRHHFMTVTTTLLKRCSDLPQSSVAA